MVAACGDDAADGTDATRADATADVSPEVILGTCPMAGAWKLQNVRCGDDDITADWFLAIDRTSVVITATADGCSVVTTNENESCREDEQAAWSLGVGNLVNVVSQGVSACEPAGCTFGGSDAACAVGDRAGGYTASLVGDGDTLTLQSPVGICRSLGAEVDTTWVLEPQ